MTSTSLPHGLIWLAKWNTSPSTWLSLIGQEKYLIYTFAQRPLSFLKFHPLYKSKSYINLTFTSLFLFLYFFTSPKEISLHPSFIFTSTRNLGLGSSPSSSEVSPWIVSSTTTVSKSPKLHLSIPREYIYSPRLVNLLVYLYWSFMYTCIIKIPFLVHQTIIRISVFVFCFPLLVDLT